MPDTSTKYANVPKEKLDPSGSVIHFFEVCEVVLIDGKERCHRKMDRAFKTKGKAVAWIKKQGGSSA